MSNNGRRTVLIMILLIAMAMSVSAQQFTGTVYTSLANGETVNANIYETKPLVYLNGGPQNQNAAGLPLGTYYFQVTDPNGATLLSTDKAECRQVQVVLNSGGKGVVFGVPAIVPAGCGFHLEGTANPTNGSKPVQLIPYLDTPNNGGEYKAWLISQDPAIGCGAEVVYVDTGDPKQLHFPSNCAKTDNFKVRTRDEQQEPPVVLSGAKYYDANDNGARDAGEALLEGWTINLYVGGALTQTTPTDADGAYGFLVQPGSVVRVCEGYPLTAGWRQSGPAAGATVSPFTAGASAGEGVCWSGTAPESDVANLDFGNNIQISGLKWYDLDKDGVKDETEVGVPGIHIIAANCTDGTCVTEVSGTTVQTSSGADGTWSLILAAPTTYYKVHELLPPGSSGVQWTQTSTPVVYIGQVGVTGATSLNFGNVCLLTGNGTIGFWGNKNGNAVLGAIPGWMTALSNLNLRNSSGNHFDPVSISGWNTYLKNATAVNMAYMLSSQMAATQLNVLRNSSGGTTVWNGSAWLTIDGAIGTANGLLSGSNCGEPCVVGSGAISRSEMEMWKNLFDTINNNQAVVQFGTGGCTVTYP